ncbi:MAG: hypothetical protein WB683_05200 [Candidatus Sulfotelmatobacter sp.]
MSRSFLYRRLGFGVIVVLAFFAVMVPSGSAQGRPELKRPEPDVPQEKPPEAKKKPVKGPRAVALLQLSSGGKATLIPIAILVDGKFYDASEYKADPVPMALDSGTVYEAEESGDSLGLFTVSGALHSKTRGAAQAWVGAGSYALNGTAVANAPHKAENVPVGLNSGDNDAPPRLTREKSSQPAAPASPSPGPASGAPASTTPVSTTPASTTPTGAGTGSSEKPAAAGSPPATSQPASGSSGSGASASQKPGVPPAPDTPQDKGDKQQAPASTAGQTSPAQSGPGQSGPGQSASGQTSPGTQAQAVQSSPDYYRPTLRRGKPTQGPPPDDDEQAPPTTGKPESTASAAAAGPAPVQLVPAISDAGGPEPKSYKFFWKTGEEEERRNQMLALARAEIQAYVKALARNQIPANPPAKPVTARHKAPAKPIQPVLENVQFHAFDVWTNNQIVMILTAEAHFPPAPGATAAPEQYSITLVTRTDIYGDPRKLYSGVTDKFHLDVTPRMELIDVVDADGDGRGELLFRETTDAGNGYVIYRAGADKLFKMFDSLGEED